MIPALADTPVAAARDLLGRRLTTRVNGEITSVLVTEVEAYGGGDDPASHAHRGRTARNAAMFAAAGTLYVYRSYGIHWCLNLVCGPVGVAGAVLLRSGVPVAGVEVMERRRGRSDRLTDGPGKFCQALAITGEHDGRTLGDGVVEIGTREMTGPIVAGPRVGISRAQERPWRLVLETPAPG